MQSNETPNKTPGDRKINKKIWAVTIVLALAILAISVAMLMSSPSSLDYMELDYMEVADATCSCCPVTSTTNNFQFGALLKELTKQTLLENYEKILREKISFEYLSGSMIDYVSGYNFSSTTDMMPQISGYSNQAVSSQTSYVNNVAAAFPAGLRTSAENVTVTSLNNLLYGYGVAPQSISRFMSSFTQTYRSFLRSAEVTQTYSGSLTSYNQQMNQQIGSISTVSNSFVNLGTKVDMSLAGTDRAGSTEGLSSAIAESVATSHDSVAMVDNIYGWQLKESVLPEYMSQYSGNTTSFAHKNMQFLLSRLVGVEFCEGSLSCDGGGGDDPFSSGSCCVILTEQDVMGIANASNASALNYTENTLNQAKQSLNGMISSGYANMQQGLTPNLQGIITSIGNVIVSGRGAEFYYQNLYAGIARNIESALGNRDQWLSVAKAPMGANPDVQRAATLLAGPDTPDNIKKAAIKRLIASKRAIDVANYFQGMLKGFDPDRMNNKKDDEAWKDIARLYYYWTVLQNETLKLHSIALVADSVKLNHAVSSTVSVRVAD